MIIFKTIEDVKKVVAASSISGSLAKLEPHLNEAVNEIIVPMLGLDIITNLSVVIDTGVGSADEKTAANYLQIAAGNLAYMLMGMDGGVQVDDGGMFRQDDQQTKSAYQWQMNDFRKTRELSGWAGLRNLYLFLEQHILDAWTADYVASDERAYLKTFFVTNDLKFNQYINISGFQTWWHMRNHMEAIQQEALKPLLTEQLYADLMNDLLVNDPDPADLDLIKLCEKVVAAGTIYRAVPLMPFKFDKGGLIITEFISNKDNSSQQTQATQFINKLHGSSLKLYTEAKDQLARYLDANASETKYISYYEEVTLARIDEERTIEDMRQQNKEGKIVGL